MFQNESKYEKNIIVKVISNNKNKFFNKFKSYTNYLFNITHISYM